MRYVWVGGAQAALVSRSSGRRKHNPADGLAAKPSALPWQPKLEPAPGAPTRYRAFHNPVFLWVSGTCIAHESVAVCWLHLKWRKRGIIGMSPDLVVLMTWCWANLVRRWPTPWTEGTKWPHDGIVRALEAAWGPEVAHACIAMIKKTSHPKHADVRTRNGLPSPWLTLQQLKAKSQLQAPSLLQWVESLFSLPFQYMFKCILEQRDMQLPEQEAAIHDAQWYDPFATADMSLTSAHVFASRYEYNPSLYVLQKTRVRAAMNFKRVAGKQQWWIQASTNVLLWGRGTCIGGTRRQSVNKQAPDALDCAVLRVAGELNEQHLFYALHLAALQLMASDFQFSVVPVLALDAPCAQASHTAESLSMVSGDVPASVTMQASRQTGFSPSLVVLAAERGVRHLQVFVPLFEALAIPGLVCDCMRSNVYVDRTKLSPAYYVDSRIWAEVPDRARRVATATAYANTSPALYQSATENVARLTTFTPVLPPLRPSFAQAQQFALRVAPLYCV